MVGRESRRERDEAVAGCGGGSYTGTMYHSTRTTVTLTVTKASESESKRMREERCGHAPNRVRVVSDGGLLFKTVSRTQRGRRLAAAQSVKERALVKGCTMTGS